MTKEELEIIEILGIAWNKFKAIEVVHQSDNDEFMRAIHAAQNIVLSRQAMRELNKKDELLPK